MSKTPISTMEYKVLSTVPAHGWVAVFNNSEARVPVEWWIVAKHRELKYLHHFGVCIWEDGPDICESFSDFDGYEMIDNRKS